MWDIYWKSVFDELVKNSELYKSLLEENNNLKNELMEDMKTESKLNEEIRNLKSELSKFRDSFKKYRDYEKEELAESCYDLARENDKLKEENKWFNKKIKQAGKYVAATMKENKNLKATIDSLWKIIDKLKKEICNFRDTQYTKDATYEDINL